MDIVINTQSVRYGQEQHIRFLYRFVPGQFFDKLLGVGRIGLSEDRPLISFDVTASRNSLLCKFAQNDNKKLICGQPNHFGLK